MSRGHADVPICIFCDGELSGETKFEHILLSALGGKKKTRDAICSRCNETFGNTIDKAVADQVVILRNLLLLGSGTGKSPPMLRKVKAGNDTISIKGDGMMDLVAKPFTITPLGDGTFQIDITARSVEEIGKCIPHIAARLNRSEEEVVQHLSRATARTVSRPPGTVHLNMSFGGELGIRSFAKSCLVLWSTLVGNDEVKSAIYKDARDFVLRGGESFAKDRVNLDSRFLPQEKELKRRFGEFFNLIYLRSDEAGRVVGHFTLYNIVAWQFVLAERGATPNLKIGFISNPMVPAIWSDTIADEIDIDFAWLISPDYFVSECHQRMGAAIVRVQKDARAREIGNITSSVFEKYGLADNAAIADPSILKKAINEIAHRAALHVMGLPYEELLLGEELMARSRAAWHKPLQE